MTWGWSHTQEAYDNARINLSGMARAKLEVVWAEWQAHVPREDEEGGFDGNKYAAALKEARGLSISDMVDFIWERMSELAECENGGFNAYCCPFGCGCHEVSFDLNLGLKRSAQRRGLLE